MFFFVVMECFSLLQSERRTHHKIMAVDRNTPMHNNEVFENVKTINNTECLASKPAPFHSKKVLKAFKNTCYDTVPTL